MRRIPSIGHLVLLKMDPVEAVAHLENPELTAACQKMCTKTYVAWVYEPGVWGGPELPYTYYTVYILHRGLRPEGEKPGIAPDMSVPILPNTVHPLGRQPLDLGKPLPWDDCYISIGYSIGGRFPTIYSDESPLHRTTYRETARVGGLIDEDLYVRRRPYGLNSNDDLELHEIPIGDTDVPVDNIWDLWDGSETDWSPDSSIRVATPLESNINSAEQDAGHGCDIPGISIAQVQQVNELPMSDYAPSGTARSVHEIDDSYMHKTVFRVSYDLDSVDVLNDPTELIKELETFYRLRDELQAKYKKSRIEKARLIDEEHFGKLESNEREDNLSACVPKNHARLRSIRHLHTKLRSFRRKYHDKGYAQNECEPSLQKKGLTPFIRVLGNRKSTLLNMIRSRAASISHKLWSSVL